MEIELGGWPGARFKSDDGLIDLPVDIAVVVDEKTVTPLELGLNARTKAGDLPDQPWSDEKILDVEARYDFRGDSLQVDGLFEVQVESEPQFFRARDCLAWPLDGEMDEDCQNRKFEEAASF